MCSLYVAAGCLGCRLAASTVSLPCLHAQDLSDFAGRIYTAFEPYSHQVYRPKFTVGDMWFARC